MALTTKQTVVLGVLGGYLLGCLFFPLRTILQLNIENWAVDNKLDKLYLLIPWASLREAVMSAVDWLAWAFGKFTGEVGLAFVTGSIIFAFWDPIARFSRKFRENPIPIAISEMQERWFGNYAHFFEPTSLEDNWVWNFGTIQIANISETKSVSLKIYLQIKGKDSPLNYRVMADGLGGPTHTLRYQQQKIINLVKEGDDKNSRTTYNVVPTGKPAPDIIRCPLNLEPQKSIESQLTFIGDPEFRNTVIQKRNEIELSIVIDDHISGNQVTIPIPGSYRGK